MLEEELTVGLIHGGDVTCEKYVKRDKWNVGFIINYLGKWEIGKTFYYEKIIDQVLSL